MKGGGGGSLISGIFGSSYISRNLFSEEVVGESEVGALNKFQNIPNCEFSVCVLSIGTME